MAICKFFQEGNCRFGNRCWNEHITNTRYSHQYNSQQRSEVNATQSSSGFSFKTALQNIGQPQPQQSVPTGRFSFTKTFNAMQNAPNFGNQLQRTQFSIIQPSGFGFQPQNNTNFGQNVSFGQSLPLPSPMSYFAGRSSFSLLQSNPENMDSNVDMDLHASEKQSVSSFGSIKPQAVSTSPAVIHSPAGENLEPSVYSPIDSLSEEELNSFKANEFTHLKIPLRPPPREMCF